MTASSTPTLTVVGAEEHRCALVIDVPADTSPEVWQLLKRVGTTLEQLVAAVADRTNVTPSTSRDGASTPAPRLAGSGSHTHENGVTYLDLKARSVSRDHDEIHLTHLEFELLAYFARNPSRAINRDELLDHVWNEPAHYSSRTIDVHIRRLRRKLGPELQLTTVRGFGYRLDGRNAAVDAPAG